MEEVQLPRRSAERLKKKKAAGPINFREELAKLDEMIEILRLEYEKHFTGLLPFAPEKLHGEVKRKIRKMWKLPFKRVESSFRLKTIEGKYSTLNTYWQRVLRERESGVYSKDIFKADIRERFAQEDTFAATKQGQAEKAMKQLFGVYKDALEQTTGRKQKIDFEAFRKVLVAKAKGLKGDDKSRKVGFKVVVSNGKVTIKAKVTNRQSQG